MVGVEEVEDLEVGVVLEAEEGAGEIPVVRR